MRVSPRWLARQSAAGCTLLAGMLRLNAAANWRGLARVTVQGELEGGSENSFYRNSASVATTVNTITIRSKTCWEMCSKSQRPVRAPLIVAGIMATLNMSEW